MTPDRLRAVPLFAELDDEVVARVAAAAHPFEAPAGSVLCEPNQVGSGLFLIEEGRAVAEMRSRTRELGPGDVVGELALLLPDGGRTARVRATSDVRCLAISRTDFEALLDAEPRIARGLLAVLAARLATAE